MEADYQYFKLKFGFEMWLMFQANGTLAFKMMLHSFLN